MTTHRFAYGEDVLLLADGRRGGRAVFTVTALLPFERDIPFYKIKGAHEAFSRVVAENLLCVPPISEPSATALEAPTLAGARLFAEAAEFSRRRRA